EGVLTADVFGGIEIVWYNDGVEVAEPVALPDAVIGNVNLLDLFNNGTRNEISVASSVPVDEIGIRLEALASVNVMPNIELYNVSVDCTIPEFIAWKSFEINEDPTLTDVSGGETVEYTIHVR